MTAHTRSENQRDFLFEDNYFHINILLFRTKTRSSYISHSSGNLGLEEVGGPVDGNTGPF